MGRLIRRLLTEERAAEVTELAIVLGLVVAGSVALLVLIGPKVVAGYTSTNTAIP